MGVCSAMGMVPSVYLWLCFYHLPEGEGGLRPGEGDHVSMSRCITRIPCYQGAEGDMCSEIFSGPLELSAISVKLNNHVSQWLLEKLVEYGLQDCWRCCRDYGCHQA